MQTEYRLLYRYMNQTTNTAVTGDAPFNEVTEFYTADHKINLDDTHLQDFKSYELKYKFDGETEADYSAKIRGEADNEREALITENMANENKSNNLFVYDGTKKVFHQQYIPEALGYIVRDWTRVPTAQIPDGPKDFSKHFVMLGGSQLGVDNAYLVCKPQYMQQYKTTWSFTLSTKDSSNNLHRYNAQYSGHYVYIKNFTEMINELNWFDWISPIGATELKYNESTPQPDFTKKTGLDGAEYLQTYYKPTGNSPATVKHYFFFGDTEFTTPPDKISSVPPVAEVGIPTEGGGGTYKGLRFDSLYQIGIDGFNIMYAETLMFDKTMIRREVIPAHYEETGKDPYYIKDVYRKIEQSPWMLHSIHRSLESGLESAKTLVSMLGINNVKLIKNVPFDQFIKIQ